MKYMYDCHGMSPIANASSLVIAMVELSPLLAMSDNLT